jgi:hypothetical protein
VTRFVIENTIETKIHHLNQQAREAAAAAAAPVAPSGDLPLDTPASHPHPDVLIDLSASASIPGSLREQSGNIQSNDQGTSSTSAPTAPLESTAGTVAGAVAGVVAVVNENAVASSHRRPFTLAEATKPIHQQSGYINTHSRVSLSSATAAVEIPGNLQHRATNQNPSVGISSAAQPITTPPRASAPASPLPGSRSPLDDGSCVIILDDDDMEEELETVDVRDDVTSDGGQGLLCPVGCGTRFRANVPNSELNQHIDECLNRSCLREST